MRIFLASILNFGLGGKGWAGREAKTVHGGKGSTWREMLYRNGKAGQAGGEQAALDENPIYVFLFWE
jgi:hypothetical protein